MFPSNINCASSHNMKYSEVIWNGEFETDRQILNCFYMTIMTGFWNLLSSLFKLHIDSLKKAAIQAKYICYYLVFISENLIQFFSLYKYCNLFC